MADQRIRPLDDIMADLEAAGRRRHELVVARDKRERDMLSAMRDVETYETRMAAVDDDLEKLFAERERTLAAGSQPA